MTQTRMGKWERMTENGLVKLLCFSLCRSSSWLPQGVYLESNRDECTVSLVYAVHLEKQGSVSFTYQYPDNNIFFEFYVRSGGCVVM